MITPNDFKEGMLYEDKDRLLEVIKYQRHRKSQGRAKVATKVRDIDTGAVLEMNYPSNTKLRDVEVRRKDFHYLYADGSSLHFMDKESYHQEAVAKEKLGDAAKFLVENMDVIGVYVDEKFRTIELPPNIVTLVSSSEPGVRGDTVSSALKNAVTETGVQVKVPLFIKEGDSIRVDTRTGEYVERVKA